LTGSVGAVQRSLITALATFGYLAVQSVCTMRNSNSWPFCSYNMFSYRVGDRCHQPRVRLVTDRGTVLGPTDPWGLLPVDFFRVESILKIIFSARASRRVRDRFCADVLRRLNARPWPRWEEVVESFRPAPGERFVGMELSVVEVDFEVCDPNDRAVALNSRVIHLHDPSGAFPGSVRAAA
jgi:hypothetical protein